VTPSFAPVLVWLHRDPRRSRVLTTIGLALLCWLAFFNQLGTLSLMDKTEALFVEVGREMAESGDWITPRWNGATFFDYPVWGYWMVALSFRLFGVSEWAARLPVALAASAVVIAGFGLIWISGGKAEDGDRRLGRAWLGAALLALNPGWVGWGRSSVTDMFLSSGISLSLFGFFLAYSQSERPGLRRLGYAATALFSAVAVLAKGPVGVVLPGLVILVFLLAQGQLLSTLRRLPWLPMLLLFLGVAAPWYVLAARQNGAAFLGGFFGFSNLQRYTSVLYSHSGPWYFYLPWCLLLLLPWSFHLPVAIARLGAWRLDWWRQRPRSAQLAPFCLIWFVVVLLFFSAAATKLAGYILPLVPAGAVLIALFWIPLPDSIAATSTGEAARRWSAWLNALALAAMAAAAALAPRWAAADPAFPGFAAALSASGLPQILALVLGAAALGLIALLLNRRREELVWLPNLLGFLGVLLFVVPGLAPLMESQRQRPVRELAVLAGKLVRPGEPLLVVGYKRYSVVFYSGHAVQFADGEDGVRERLKEIPPGSGGAPVATPSDTVLLFGEEQVLRRLPLESAAIDELASRGGKRLWRVPRGRLMAEPRQGQS
jgi:4-amino-4-deoxy-L-arabinose transferase-like glycosyltransferase